MTLEQTNKIRMFSATNMVLKNFSHLFEGLEVLQLKQQLFETKLTKLEEHRQLQEQSTSGLTLSKEILRGDVENLVLRISVGLVAFATATNDVNLKKKTKYTPSKLGKVSDLVLCDIAINVMKLATPRIAELGVYFVTQNELDVLQQKVVEFKLAIPQNRVATSSRKASTATIVALIKETNLLLKEEIDALIMPFQFINPEFYQQYKNARIIVDYTGRGRANIAEEPESTESSAE